MATQTSLRTLISKKPRTFLTLSTATTHTTTTTPPLYRWQSPSHRLLSLPLCKWIPPFQGMGPLFLSCPPWKLSQSATPLYLRGNAAVLRKVGAFNLKLIQERIGPGYVSSGQLVLDRLREKDRYEDRGGSVVVKESFVESFLNLPNFISIARLVSGPFLGWMIMNEMYSYAFVGLGIAGLSDWLDGYVARKMKIDSVVGSYLDPLADKVLIGSVTLAMVHMDLLHPGVVGLVVFRDVGLVGGAVYHRASTLGWKWSSWYDFFNLDGTKPEKVEPLFISKVNTVFQLALVAAALLQPDFGTEDTQTYIKYLSWLVASTTVASTGAYGAKYWGNRSTLLARKSLP